ncbi:MFS transporter [Plantactinospora sp. KLBMP9567]|uniref:MFS transporter n=1 Tax=Plantactinospora sp. KLBMP9567 TaxID=3085900 RepID=UPI002981DE22|nr:MFS transporter [Plantactinospora sp. KLBMP9567]MDW5328507.1 MFS transporter [Plantactinospora sp. KLBMP9567]
MSRLSIPSDRSAVRRRTAAQNRGLKPTLVLAVGTFAVGTDAFVVAGFLPEMADTLHVSTAAAGQSVTVFALSYAVLAPLVATVTARVPRRPLLVGALLVLCVANLGSALATSLPMLIATRVAAAAGAAAYTPNAGAVSAALVRPELRARALAVVVGGLTVATALGVPLGGVASQWLGWRAALGTVAGLCLLVAVGVRLIMPSLPGNPRTPLRTRLAVLRRPGVLTVLPLTVLGMAACYTGYAYAVPALGAAGIPPTSVSLMLFLYGVGAVVGNLLSGYTTDRWGPTRVLGTGYLGMVTCLALLGWAAGGVGVHPAVVGVLVLVWGASSWCQTPPQQHRLIEAAPQEAPLVVSLNSSGIYLGIGLGTTIGGLAVTSGAAAAFAVGAAGALAALLFLLATAPARRAGSATG